MILLQTAIADYRNSFIDSAETIFNDDFKIYVGEHYFEPSTRTSEHVLGKPYTHKISNYFLFNNKVCIQSLPFTKVIAEDVVVFELNPRILTNWPVMILRRLCGKKNVLWGHAWSRSGSSSKTEILRHLMRRLSHSLLFYTEQQKKEFIEKYPNYKGNAFVAPNSLYKEADINAAPIKGNDILYVGRLVQSKKVKLLIESFALAINSLPADSKLHIVGSGPESDALKNLAGELEISEHVIFYGHVSDVNQLKSIYEKSLLSVSPGYVGLSITQSFAFGRPMLIADKENHSPEIEAFVNQKNGLFFTADNPDDLKNKLVAFLNDSESWQSKFESIAQDCKERYSTENMANGFANAIRN